MKMRRIFSLILHSTFYILHLIKSLSSDIQSVRLACVRRAASVRPEPGSNSLNYGIIYSFEFINLIIEYFTLTFDFRLR